MPTTFRPCPPKRKPLLLPRLQDWLPEDHLAHHVSDLVDGLDLMSYCAPYEARVMVKLLIYGYATGVFSTRGMAKKLEKDVVF